ncbi:MAG: hypothetical protein JST14_03905 [Bacteroidetes bacterium]|nr:hypothetical protein [Bacteroidota bacterium]
MAKALSLFDECLNPGREWALPKTWHIRHDWSFTPFVVVVGCKYFLPVPVCLLFDLDPLK